MIVDVAFRYLAQVRRPPSRRVDAVFLEGRQTVEVPEASVADAPLALEYEDPTGVHVLRSFEGRLYERTKGVDDPAKAAADGSLFDPSGVAADTAEDDARVVVVSSFRQEAVRRLTGVVLLDGEAWTACGRIPLFHLAVAGDAATGSVSATYFQAGNVAFSLHDLAFVGPGLRAMGVDLREAVAMPAFVLHDADALRSDAETRSLAHGAEGVLREMRRDLERMPERHLVAFARLRDLCVPRADPPADDLSEREHGEAVVRAFEEATRAFAPSAKSVSEFVARRTRWDAYVVRLDARAELEAAADAPDEEAVAAMAP